LKHNVLLYRITIFFREKKELKKHTIFRMDDLEIFDRGLGDAATKVEHKRLGLCENGKKE